MRKRWIVFSLCLVVLGFVGTRFLPSKQMAMSSAVNQSVSKGLGDKKTRRRKQSVMAKKRAAQRQPAQANEDQQKKQSFWNNEDSVFATLKKLAQCYKQEGLCGFSQEDPKAEHFAIGQEIKKQLLNLHHQVMQRQEKSESLAALARHFLASRDGHVKEAALHLLSSQELTEKNLRAILNQVIAYHDASLIENAMLQLQRYQKAGIGEELIARSLVQALQNGSPQVSAEVAKNLAPFVSQKTRSLYQQTLSRLSLGSVTYRWVQNALLEFDRNQSAA